MSSLMVVPDSMLWKHSKEKKIFKPDDEILIDKNIQTTSIDMNAQNFYTVRCITNYRKDHEVYGWLDSYYHVVERLGDIDEALEKLFLSNYMLKGYYHSALDSEFLIKALTNTEKTYDFGAHKFVYRKHIDYDQIKDKINRKSLMTLNVSELKYFIMNIENKDSEDVCDLINYMINNIVNSKTRVNDMQIIYHTIKTYLQSITNDSKRKEEKFWHFVELIESRYSKKTKKLIRVICEVFASSDVYNIEYDAKRDYSMLNEYFVYHTEMWSVRRIVLNNLEHIKDIKAIKYSSELLRYATEEERKRWYARANKTDELQPLANRIREVNYHNLGIIIDLIYLSLSSYSEEQIENVDFDVVANAIIDHFKHFYNQYCSSYIQDEMLKNKNNMDYLAKAIVNQLEQRTNISSKVKHIVFAKKQYYFYESIYNAVMESENKKIKKALLTIAVE